jgi:acetyl esterase
MKVEDLGPANKVQPARLVVYKTAGTKTAGMAELKLHIFNPPGHVAGDKRPAVVFFFGGGWNGGSAAQFYPHCLYLASRGMVAVSADYRVNSLHGTTPAECVADGKSAVRWLRRHAAELGIDPDRLAAGGGSAGAQVAAATAFAKGFDEPGEDTAVSCRPAALVLFNPVVDNGPDGYGHDRVKDYWRNFSPLHNIGPEPPPPAAFFLGTADRLIPVATGERFRDRIVEAGGRCELHLYPEQPHGFFNYKYTENFFATVTAMDRFLVVIGFLAGPPTLEAPAAAAQ